MWWMQKGALCLLTSLQITGLWSCFVCIWLFNQTWPWHLNHEECCSERHGRSQSCWHNSGHCLPVANLSFLIVLEGNIELLSKCKAAVLYWCCREMRVRNLQPPAWWRYFPEHWKVSLGSEDRLASSDIIQIYGIWGQNDKTKQMGWVLLSKPAGGVAFLHSCCCYAVLT